MEKNYEKYLIESVAYSFDDDVAEEGNEFDMKKISRAEKILHSLVTYELRYKVETNITDYYNYAENEPDEKFIIVSQEYFDSSFKSWCFPEDNAGNYYEIFRIRYVQSSTGKELIDFDLYCHKKQDSGAESVSGCYTVYDISKKQFSQFESQGAKIIEVEKGTKTLYNYNDPELEMTILEIIDMFKK